MEIRRALPTEADLLADLWLRSRSAAAPSIPPTTHSDADVHQWFGEVVLLTCEAWVADRDGEVVALMVLDNEWISQLYVDPAAAGEGIGSDLIGHAKEARPTGLKLWTFQGNLRARRFYDSHGFVATASTTGENEEQEPDVRYEWRPSDPPG
jgi:GNAT superfamily N-acetyltransferase